MRIEDKVLKTLKGVCYQVGISDTILITFGDIEVKYDVGRTHLANISAGPNRAILLLIYGQNYADDVEMIYGYKKLGDWPPYTSLKDLQRLLADMESRGAIIEIL